MKDLVVLVPDKNIEFALRGALGRPEAMTTRPITHEYRSHMGRDGGVRTTGVDVLALERRRFTHALLVFDLEGCGAAAGSSARDLESELDAKLHVSWGSNAKAIVIEPEADIWIWGSDNALQQAVQWPLDLGIRAWLSGKGFAFDDDDKPRRPKEALDAMRLIHRQPRSSALYEKVTTQISLQRCTDPAFRRLRESLQIWFPRVQ